MAQIDIEIEDYLDEVRTEYLVKEIARRKDAVEEIKKHKHLIIPGLDEFAIPDFKTPEQMLKYLKLVLHLKPWHDKKRIIQEINEL